MRRDVTVTAPKTAVFTLPPRDNGSAAIEGTGGAAHFTRRLARSPGITPAPRRGHPRLPADARFHGDHVSEIARDPTAGIYRRLQSRARRRTAAPGDRLGRRRIATEPKRRVELDVGVPCRSDAFPPLPAPACSHPRDRDGPGDKMRIAFWYSPSQ